MEHSESCMCHLCLEPSVTQEKRRYIVRGICFVPVEAEIEVEATSAEGANWLAECAWKTNKRALIVRNSADENAAFDWQHTAKLI